MACANAPHNAVPGTAHRGFYKFIAGWSSPVARQAHNLKVVGSNPTPAPKQAPEFHLDFRGFVFIQAWPVSGPAP